MTGETANTISLELSTVPRPQELSHGTGSEPNEGATTSRSRADYTFPEGGSKAWLVVFGSFCVIAGTFGLLASNGIFQAYWQEHQLSNYSTGDIGWISSVNVFLTCLLGVQVGPLFDKYGPGYLLGIGSVVYVVSLLLLGQCTEYWEIMLVYGVVNGTSNACLTTTALAVVAHWFHVRRGMASGIIFVGSSVAGIAFPLVLQPLFRHLSWAWSMRALALIVAILMGIGNLCIKARLPSRVSGGSIDLRIFKDPRFSWATIGVACFEFVLFGALGLLPIYALNQGFSSQTSFNVIAVLNAGSAFGRYFAGYISDKFGRFNTMGLTLLLSLIVTFIIWLPFGTNVVGLYIFAPLFGMGSGSVISMAPVCMGQLCQSDEYGQFYGTSYSVVAFAVLLSIPVGGELLSAVGSSGFVCFFGGMLVLSMTSFVIARWACLDYKWAWYAKI